jgi:uncharacterized protein
MVPTSPGGFVLQNTFCHIPDVGVKTEARLWEAGIRSWNDLVQSKNAPLSNSKLDHVRSWAKESSIRYGKKDAAFFAEKLPSFAHWRLYADFQGSTAYLDIETTGVAPPNDHITSIAMYGRGETRAYVHGRNLHEFVEDVKSYDLLVSFNGACFDIPVIEKTFGITLSQAHIDLRFVLKAAGMEGGLKKCERACGLHRGDLDGINGYGAVLLWRKFRKTRDERVLETLLAYNAEDAVNLEPLAVKAYNLHLCGTPFADSHRLPTPQPWTNPYRADPKVLKWLRRAMPR